MPGWKRRYRQLRYFIYLLGLCIILILILVFLNRVDYLHLKAEQMAVQGMIRSMQAAVLMQTDLGNASQKRADPGENPMNFMDYIPDNYLGELDRVQPKKIQGGQWYFDKNKDMLIYRIKNTEGFGSKLSGPARIRFKIKEAKDIKHPKTILSCGPELCLAIAEPYTW